MTFSIDDPAIQIFLALSSAFVTACYFVCMSGTMKGQRALSSLFTLSYSHLLAAASMIPLLLWFSSITAASLTIQSLALLIVVAGLLLLSRMLYFYAYGRTEVANITVFSALTPVYAILTGYFFLHESLTVGELAGLAVICASLYGYFLPPKQYPASLFAPFRRVVSSKPVLFAFLSTIPTAFAATAQKHLLVGHMDVMMFCFLLFLCIGLGALTLYLTAHPNKSIRQQTACLPFSFYFASLLLLPLMHILFCLVILHQPTAIALVLQRTSIVFQVLLAYFFLKERDHPGKKTICIGLMFVGFWLIMR